MKFFFILLCFYSSMILNQQLNSQDSIPKNPSTYLDTDNGLDAAFHLEKEDKNYFFKQKIYVRLFKNKVEAGYPTKIQNGWKDLPQYWKTGIDAALRCKPQKKTIFFKGREYFTIQNGYPVDKFPRKLPGEFKNLPRYFHSNIDGSVYLPHNHRMYLFKGNQYVRIKHNKVEQGYPKKMPGEFKHLPLEFCTDIDAVLHRKGDTYFFKNGQYARYNKSGVHIGFQKNTEPE